MFIHFSWSQYFLYAGILLAIYLLIIGWMYYRGDIYDFLFAKRDSLHAAIVAPVQHSVAYSLPEVHEAVSELGLLIRAAGENNTLPPELFYSIQQLLKNYRSLEQSDYKESISEYIIQEMKRYLSYQFTVDEMKRLWVT